jgi:hypothetical protein
MKKILLTLATVMSLTSVVYLTSCEEDPCKTTDCGVHGTCNAGTCDCASGYEIDKVNGRCDIIVSSNFISDYTAAEFDQSTPLKPIQVKDGTGKLINLTYAGTIKAVTGDINKVTITNLGDYLCKKNGVDTKVEIPATVKGDTLTFSFTDCNNTFVGKGILNRTAKTVTFKYSNTYPLDATKPTQNIVTDKSTAVYTKK